MTDTDKLVQELKRCWGPATTPTTVAAEHRIEAAHDAWRIVQALIEKANRAERLEALLASDWIDHPHEAWWEERAALLAKEQPE